MTSWPNELATPVALVSPTNWAALQGEMLMTKAEISQMAGAPAEAVGSLCKALRLFQEFRAVSLAERTGHYSAASAPPPTLRRDQMTPSPHKDLSSAARAMFGTLCYWRLAGSWPGSWPGNRGTLSAQSVLGHVCGDLCR